MIFVVACRSGMFCPVAGKIAAHGEQWRGDR
jgi:hypothetical protein